MMTLLTWIKDEQSHALFAQLGPKEDGVSFSLCHYPNCYRRGPWRLFVEVCSGLNHQLWGCFDSQDQPLRYFHSEECARREAEALAQVLLKDRNQKAPQVIVPALVSADPLWFGNHNLEVEGSHYAGLHYYNATHHRIPIAFLRSDYMHSLEHILNTAARQYPL